MHKKNEYISEAADTIYRLTQEKKIRQQCEDREEFFRRQRSVQALHEKELNDQKLIIMKRENTIREQDTTIKGLASEIEALKA